MPTIRLRTDKKTPCHEVKWIDSTGARRATNFITFDKAVSFYKRKCGLEINNDDQWQDDWL